MSKIVRHNWDWAYPPAIRQQAVRFLALHHTVVYTSAEQIHRDHKDMGDAGMPYNWLIDLDGDRHEGRKLWQVGAHTHGYNSVAIGIAVVGNYDTHRAMPGAQLTGLRECIEEMREEFRGVGIKGHNEFSGNATACPGRYYPFKAALANPLETIPVRLRSNLKVRMRSWAITYNAKYPDDVFEIPSMGLKSDGWGESAQLLAKRVSYRVQRTDPRVVTSALPTRALYNALHW